MDYLKIPTLKKKRIFYIIPDMAYICESCGKKIVAGRTQVHHRGVAGKRWKKRAPMTLRTFKPNLQNTTILVDGTWTKMKLCAKCIKKFKSKGLTASSQTSHLGIHA